MITRIFKIKMQLCNYVIRGVYGLCFTETFIQYIIYKKLYIYINVHDSLSVMSSKDGISSISVGINSCKTPVISTYN